MVSNLSTNKSGYRAVVYASCNWDTLIDLQFLDLHVWQNVSLQVPLNVSLHYVS
jgi:hypothetical protein